MSTLFKNCCTSKKTRKLKSLQTINKTRNQRSLQFLLVTERCSKRARTLDVLMRPQRLSSRVVFANREWSSNYGRTELEIRNFAGQRRAFLSIARSSLGLKGEFCSNHNEIYSLPPIIFDTILMYCDFSGISQCSISKHQQS